MKFSSATVTSISMIAIAKATGAFSLGATKSGKRKCRLLEYEDFIHFYHL